MFMMKAVEPPAPMLVDISPNAYREIFAAARLQEFERGEALYLQGDATDRVFLLVSGFAKVTQLGANGPEVILRFCMPGDMVGASGLWTGSRHSSTAHAFRPCRAHVWDAPVFKSLMQRFPALHRNLVRILEDELVELAERFREVSTENVGARVASQLIRLIKRMGRPVGGGFEIELTREQLAQMTGTTLFTVSRLLSSWEGRGAVKRRREAVTICDVHSLRAISAENL